MRFTRKGRSSRPERVERLPVTPPVDTGGYDVVQLEGVDHLIPEMDGVHEALSTCACDPIQAQNVRGPNGNVPTWLHRSIPSPL